MQVIEQLKRMKEERFLHLYDSLAQDGFGPLDGEVAGALKFRPQMIRKVPMDKRARHARAILTRGANAELCYELFGSYLLKNAKDLVTGFLDKTGVPHKEGMIDDVENDMPAGDKVAAAVAELDKEFDPADVTLYLSLAAEQWPSVPEVDAAWQMRA